MNVILLVKKEHLVIASWLGENICLLCQWHGRGTQFHSKRTYTCPFWDGNHILWALQGLIQGYNSKMSLLYASGNNDVIKIINCAGIILYTHLLILWKIDGAQLRPKVKCL